MNKKSFLLFLGVGLLIYTFENNGAYENNDYVVGNVQQKNAVTACLLAIYDLHSFFLNPNQNTTLEHLMDRLDECMARVVFLNALAVQGGTIDGDVTEIIDYVNQLNHDLVTFWVLSSYQRQRAQAVVRPERFIAG